MALTIAPSVAPQVLCPTTHGAAVEGDTLFAEPRLESKERKPHSALGKYEVSQERRGEQAATQKLTRPRDRKQHSRLILGNRLVGCARDDDADSASALISESIARLESNALSLAVANERLELVVDQLNALFAQHRHLAQVAAPFGLAASLVIVVFVLVLGGGRRADRVELLLGLREFYFKLSRVDALSLGDKDRPAPALKIGLK
jgi:hypothetical protein